jgi:hypothetical protein
VFVPGFAAWLISPLIGRQEATAAKIFGRHLERQAAREQEESSELPVQPTACLASRLPPGCKTTPRRAGVRRDLAAVVCWKTGKSVGLVTATKVMMGTAQQR